MATTSGLEIIDKGIREKTILESIFDFLGIQLKEFEELSLAVDFLISVYFFASELLGTPIRQYDCLVLHKPQEIEKQVIKADLSIGFGEFKTLEQVMSINLIQIRRKKKERKIQDYHNLHEAVINDVLTKLKKQEILDRLTHMGSVLKPIDVKELGIKIAHNNYSNYTNLEQRNYTISEIVYVQGANANYERFNKALGLGENIYVEISKSESLPTFVQSKIGVLFGLQQYLLHEKIIGHEWSKELDKKEDTLLIQRIIGEKKELICLSTVFPLDIKKKKFLIKNLVYALLNRSIKKEGALSLPNIVGKLRGIMLYPSLQNILFFMDERVATLKDSEIDKIISHIKESPQNIKNIIDWYFEVNGD